VGHFAWELAELLINHFTVGLALAQWASECLNTWLTCSSLIIVGSVYISQSRHIMHLSYFSHILWKWLHNIFSSKSRVYIPRNEKQK